MNVIDEIEFSQPTRTLLVIIAPYFNAYNQYSARDVLNVAYKLFDTKYQYLSKLVVFIQAFHLLSLNLFTISRIGSI